MTATMQEILDVIEKHLDKINEAAAVADADLQAPGLSMRDKLVSYDSLTLKLKILALKMDQHRKEIR